MAKGKPRSVKVVQKAGHRFVVVTYADGEVVSKQIYPNEQPRRKSRKPYARAGHRELPGKAVQNRDVNCRGHDRGYGGRTGSPLR